MNAPECDLALCSRRADWIRVCSPARDFLENLCDCHWLRLQEKNIEMARCYEPIAVPERLARTASGLGFQRSLAVEEHTPRQHVALPLILVTSENDRHVAERDDSNMSATGTG